MDDQNKSLCECIGYLGIVLLTGIVLLFFAIQSLPEATKMKSIQEQEPQSIGYNFLAEGRDMSKHQAYQEGIIDRNRFIDQMQLLSRVKGADNKSALTAAQNSYFNMNTLMLSVQDITIKARSQGIPEEIIGAYKRGRMEK